MISETAINTQKALTTNSMEDILQLQSEKNVRKTIRESIKRLELSLNENLIVHKQSESSNAFILVFMYSKNLIQLHQVLEILNERNWQEHEYQYVKRKIKQLIQQISIQSFNKKITKVINYMEIQVEKIFTRLIQASNQQISPNYIEEQKAKIKIKFFSKAIHLFKSQQFFYDCSINLKEYPFVQELFEKNQSYNMETFYIWAASSSSKNLQKLNHFKTKIQIYLQGEVYRRSVDNNSKHIECKVKQRRLKKLLWHIKKRIQQVSEQEDFLVPYDPKKYWQDSKGDLKRKINFLIVGAWVISFYLANKDGCHCLDDEINGSLVNFRLWLRINAWFTLSLTIFDVLVNLLFEEPIKNSITSFCSSPIQKCPQCSSCNRCKNCESCMQCQTCPDQPSRVKVVCLWIYKRADCIINGLFLLSLGSKFGWIFFGIILFLGFVDFSRCSDNVLVYCSIEFLAFFTIFIYFVTIYLIQNSRNILSFILSKCKKQLKIESETTFDFKEDWLELNKADRQEQSFMIPIYGHQNDISDVWQKAITWFFVGWVYDFVLWRKDQSLCLNDEYSNNLVTYRTWIVIDGWSNLGLFIFTIVLLIIKERHKNSFTIWRMKKRMTLLEVNLKQNLFTKILSIFLIIFCIFKFGWVLFGIVMLFNFFDPNPDPVTEKSRCSSNVTAFLIAYFSETIFISIEGGMYIARGFIFQHIFSPDRQNRIESITRNSSQSSLQSYS